MTSRHLQGLRRCSEILDRQHGAIARWQSRKAGLPDVSVTRLVHNGQWRRELPSIFCSNAAPRTHNQALMALALWCERKGALSHWSAAHVLGLKVPKSELLEATVKTCGRSPRRDIRLHHGIVLPTSDYHRANGMLVTTAARTLFDMACHLEEEELEIAIDDALRRKLTTLRRLLRQDERCSGRGRPGSTTFRRVLEARTRTRHGDSGLETRIARALRHPAVPSPVPQFRITDRGRFIARVDFAWPEAKVALECESYEFHSGRVEWKLDVTRLNEVAALGWIVQRGTNEDADDPRRLIARLVRLIEERTRDR
jgi:very-short-patch-repair endonuclease